MRFLTLLVLAVTVLAVSLFAQVNPTQVTIARDSYGVPRIFATTDAEVACVLTWAHAEDDFKTIQLLILPMKGLMGRHLSKEGPLPIMSSNCCTRRNWLPNRVPRRSPQTIKRYSTGICRD